MNEYHKIRTLWARESAKPHNMMPGVFDKPEFECLANASWDFTEKVDGTNIRVMWDGNRVSFGGKTDNAQIPVKLLDHLAEVFQGEPNEQRFESVFGSTPACLYGEGFGGNIQKAGKLYGDFNFALFDVRIGQFWLERENVTDVAGKLGVMPVPIVGTGSLYDFSEMVARGFLSIWGKASAEGAVARPSTELFTRQGERVITKLKHKDFVKLGAGQT